MTGLGSGILIIETDSVHQASHHLRILATKKSHVSLSVLMALIQVKSLITRSTVSFWVFVVVVTFRTSFIWTFWAYPSSAKPY